MQQDIKKCNNVSLLNDKDVKTIDQKKKRRGKKRTIIIDRQSSN